MTLTFSASLWLFTVAVTLHMIEEIIWLPGWSQDAGKWHEPVTRREFGIATGIMLAYLYLIVSMALSSPVKTVGIYLVCGLALVMIVNLFIPHLGAVISQRRYAPGLASSVLLVVPSAILLIWQAFAEQLISMPLFLLVGLGFLAATAVIWPMLFRIGRRP